MIPDFQEIMLPLLTLITDGDEHSVKDLYNSLAKHFGLTEEDLSLTLRSGHSIFQNRTNWAKTYLKKAGLIDYPKRASISITERGRELLQQKPGSITTASLKRYAEFTEFIRYKPTVKSNSDEQESGISESISTPEENLESAFLELRKTLADDLLLRVMQSPPSFFERLVVELLVKMGYGGSVQEAGKVLGKTGDEGIDGIIKEDKLGLDVIYIQAKRWKKGNSVGRPEIQKFVGALAGQGAKKGIFIITSNFTEEAKAYTPKNETKIVLIDGEQLAQLMIDYSIGCTTVQTFEVKKLDSDYFEE